MYAIILYSPFKKYLQCKIYVDTFIQAGAIVCPCVDIVKHVQFIHLSLYWIFFSSATWGGMGGEVSYPWKFMDGFPHNTMLNGSLRNMYILNTRIIPCWIPGLPPCEKFRSSFNLIRRTAAPLFSSSLGFPRNSKILKGVWYEIFDFRFFSWISFPLGLSILMGPLWIVRKFAEIFATLCLSKVAIIYRRWQRHRKWNTCNKINLLTSPKWTLSKQQPNSISTASQQNMKKLPISKILLYRIFVKIRNGPYGKLRSTG